MRVESLSGSTHVFPLKSRKVHRRALAKSALLGSTFASRNPTRASQSGRRGDPSQCCTVSFHGRVGICSPYQLFDRPSLVPCLVLAKRLFGLIEIVDQMDRLQRVDRLEGSKSISDGLYRSVRSHECRLPCPIPVSVWQLDAPMKTIEKLTDSTSSSRSISILRFSFSCPYGICCPSDCSLLISS